MDKNKQKVCAKAIIMPWLVGSAMRTLGQVAGPHLSPRGYLAAMSVVLTELHYLPSIPFFQQLLSTDAVLLDAHEHYHKQTYRNRCLVLTAQGPQPLTVPVVDGARAAKVRTSEIEIDYRQNWPHRHFRTLQTAYGASPYFSYYADYLQDIYNQKPARLWDLNLAFLELLFRCLRWPLPVAVTAEYLPPTPPLSGQKVLPVLLDHRDFLTPKSRPAGTEPDSPSARPYPQVFGTAFVPSLSVLDLLFMQGPQAGHYL